ncbi:MAG TPA: GxxExxY protein [Pyrinomonadaceae bacterium]|nr:GxxExxY protein [Pyrinomonadaceae bacterium]
MDNLKHSEITGQIIKAFYKVYNTLGYGFLERVYENALFLELQEMGLNAVKQAPIKVFYNDQEVGEYFADLIVENCVIIELKAVENLLKVHEAQLLNYLKATEIEVGLLLNFGTTAEYRRKVFNNTRKNLKDALLNQ